MSGLNETSCYFNGRAAASKESKHCKLLLLIQMLHSSTLSLLPSETEPESGEGCQEGQRSRQGFFRGGQVVIFGGEAITVCLVKNLEMIKIACQKATFFSHFVGSMHSSYSIDQAAQTKRKTQAKAKAYPSVIRCKLSSFLTSYPRKNSESFRYKEKMKGNNTLSRGLRIQVDDPVAHCCKMSCATAKEAKLCLNQLRQPHATTAL